MRAVGEQQLLQSWSSAATMRVAFEQLDLSNFSAPLLALDGM
jgi:hypothetical protein